MSTSIPASEVVVGDVVEGADGTRVRVDRIDPFLFPGMTAFVEDSEEKWFKLLVRTEDPITVVERASAPA